MEENDDVGKGNSERVATFCVFSVFTFPFFIFFSVVSKDDR